MGTNAVRGHEPVSAALTGELPEELFVYDSERGMHLPGLESDSALLDPAHFDPDLDRPHDHCGVFGVYAPNVEYDVARLTYFGIYALQHRGQESAGIAVTDGEGIRVHKNMGLVSQVFDERSLSSLKGHMAIGHTRYSTTGSSVLRNAQPIVVETAYGPIAVAHNGNIVNTQHLRHQLEEDGIKFESTNDSEVLARCIGSLHRGDIVRAVRETMAEVEGAYSVAVLTPTQLLAFRDPNGIRPLCVATLNGSGYVVSSETCALNAINAKLIRELEPGELVVIDRNGLTEYPSVLPQRPAMCVFEFIYLARPDSQIYGKSLHAARVRMGHELFHEHPADAQVVIGVPDTGIPAAIGFSQASHIPFNEGLIKNRYIGRTFIEPDQRMREQGVRMKLSALKENLAGRRVVMVDDSIVRGTTTGQIVRLIREAGATQVHVRISSPPVKWPCFYGIDMADRKDLIAAKRTIEEIRQHIGADSLGYLSVKGLTRAVGMNRDRFCHACFTGDYPIEVPKDLHASKFQLEVLNEGNSARAETGLMIARPENSARTENGSNGHRAASVPGTKIFAIGGLEVPTEELDESPLRVPEGEPVLV